MVNKRCKLCKLNHIDKEICPNYKERKLCSSNYGITLIALVVTIIVLLILAGITITTVLGDNGVIELAKQAKKETVVATVKEAIDIAKLSKSLEKEDGLITEDELKEILENYGEIIYDESGEIIEGIIENQEGYEVLLPDIMDGVINQNIYVKLYANGTLAFSNNKNTVIEGTQIGKDYGNIKGQGFSMTAELKPGGDSSSAYDWTFITNAPWGKDRTSITNVTFLDEVKPSSTSSWFAGCTSLTEFKNLQNLNTKYVTNMSYMFASCTTLESLDLTSLNTQKVDNFESIFASCWNLKNLNVSNVNTSSAIDVSRMFYMCERLTIIDVSKFDTRNVTNMGEMFRNCSNLTSIDLSNFNTNKVENMGYMFSVCRSITSLDISNFDTGKVINMSGMFQTMASLQEIKGLENFDTSNVTNMSNMFYNCSSLTDLNLNNFNTSNVTNMATMFWNCTNLINLRIDNFNTSNVTTMWTMFENCKNLTTLDLSSFDTGNVTTMETMFNYCTKLTTIYVGSNWVINPNTNTTNMFKDCGTSSVTLKP